MKPAELADVYGSGQRNPEIVVDAAPSLLVFDDTSESLARRPAGHACNVLLREPLESTHIYLRSDLFAGPDGSPGVISGLAPMLGDQDAVLEHLASAVGDTITGGLPASSLFVDPIAQAIANRFVAINFHKPSTEAGKHPNLLSGRQMARIRELRFWGACLRRQKFRFPCS
jgi:hypothetical protein